MSSASFNRPGAMDLSQLAARAKQSQGPTGGAGRPAAGGAGYVLEVTEQDFESEVLRRSSQYPVVIEFYSPRAGASGDQLSRSLAELAAEAAGKFLVARLNVDAAPQIIAALRLQAVPTVIGAIGGQLAPLFQGALPKEEVRAYLDELLKAAVANGIVGRAEGSAPAAEEVADEAGPDPRFAEADAALERGDFAAAEAEFDRLLAADPADAEAKAGKAQAGLLARTAAADPTAVLAAADAPGADVDTQLTAADVQLAQGDAEAAFARLVGLVRTSAGPDRDRVRVRLLELFETLGNADPRVQKARRDLMTALF